MSLDITHFFQHTQDTAPQSHHKKSSLYTGRLRIKHQMVLLWCFHGFSSTEIETLLIQKLNQVCHFWFQAHLWPFLFKYQPHRTKSAHAILEQAIPFSVKAFQRQLKSVKLFLLKIIDPWTHGLNSNFFIRIVGL